jgi:hypothetical protein
MTATLDDVTAAATAYGTDQYAQGQAAQQAMDAPVVAALNASVAQLTAQDAADEKTIAALQAQIAILTNPNQPTPPADVDYGGTSGWGAATVVDLTKEPKGTTYTSGQRKTADQSSNTKDQALWGPSGLTIAAQRTPTGIVSADVLMQGVKMTAPFAMEAAVEVIGFGPGMGPALWARGKGEIDFFEMLGSNFSKGIAGGKGTFESKATLIYVGGTGQSYNQGQDANGIPPIAGGTTYDGLRHYRAELTDDGFSDWVDGELVWAETKAAFEKSAGAGKFSQFAAGSVYYPRLTFQVNNGTSSKLWGTAPGSWTKSTIRLGELRIYNRA